MNVSSILVGMSGIEQLERDLNQIADNSGSVEITFHLEKLMKPDGNYSKLVWRDIVRLILEGLIECQHLTDRDSVKASQIMAKVITSCMQLSQYDSSIIGDINISIQPLEELEL